ncbi:MAG: hypothetical protein IPL61_18200 [Myxococcales bacterium]|nr:hypothetical protein [Myxococcales bacterium]
MSDERTLAQLAEAGRARSAAQATAAAQVAAAARAEEIAAARASAARTKAIAHTSSRRSLTAWQAANLLNLTGGVGALVLASAGVVAAVAVALTQPLALAVALLPLAAFGALFGFAAWRVGAAIQRDRALRAALPFRVLGYEEALAMGRSYPSDRVTIWFEGAAPERRLLVDLLALLPQPTTILATTATSVELEVNSNVGSKFDGYRRWFVRWFYALCEDALVPLAKVYPIERIEFRA